MRRTPLLIAAVSLVAAATPAALLAGPSDVSKGKAPEAHQPAKAKAPKGTLHLINACVTADATESGVDLISSGSITHSAKALDISLEIEAVASG